MPKEKDLILQLMALQDPYFMPPSVLQPGGGGAEEETIRQLMAMKQKELQAPAMRPGDLNVTGKPVQRRKAPEPKKK
jgi:hypothetical protein